MCASGRLGHPQSGDPPRRPVRIETTPVPGLPFGRFAARPARAVWPDRQDRRPRRSRQPRGRSGSPGTRLGRPFGPGFALRPGLIGRSGAEAAGEWFNRSGRKPPHNIARTCPEATPRSERGTRRAVTRPAVPFGSRLRPFRACPSGASRLDPPVPSGLIVRTEGPAEADSPEAGADRPAPV
jgi:hypothetical protein